MNHAAPYFTLAGRRLVLTWAVAAVGLPLRCSDDNNTAPDRVLRACTTRSSAWAIRW